MRRMMEWLLWHGVAALLGTTTLMADTIPGRWELVESLPANTAIAVRDATGETITGQFVGLQVEHLLLRDSSGSERRIRRSEIHEITKPGPRRKRFWTGTKIGAVAGFAAGFTIGFAAGDDGVFDDFTGGFNGCVLGGMLAGAGSVTGYTLDRIGRRPAVIYRARNP